MPKRKSNEINCDTLEWVVDILGTTDLLSSIIDAPADDLTKNIILKRELKKNIVNLPNGIYFDGAHWYSVKNGIKEDSYSLNYQIKGTAHFCQTFAVMIYLNQTSELLPGMYAHNIQIAIEFWLKLFKLFPAYLNYIIDEIKTSIYADENYILYGTDIYLKNITKKQFITFLNQLIDHAQIFVGCKQG